AVHLRSTAPVASSRRRKPAPWKWGSSPASWCWIALSSRNRPTLWAAPGCSAPSSKARRSTPLPVLRAADPACPQDRLWMLSMPADDREGHDDGRWRRGGRGAGALPGICGDRADEWSMNGAFALGAYQPSARASARPPPFRYDGIALRRWLPVGGLATFQRPPALTPGRGDGFRAPNNLRPRGG